MFLPNRKKDRLSVRNTTNWNCEFYPSTYDRWEFVLVTLKPWNTFLLSLLLLFQHNASQVRTRMTSMVRILLVLLAVYQYAFAEIPPSPLKVIYIDLDPNWNEPAEVVSQAVDAGAHFALTMFAPRSFKSRLNTRFQRDHPCLLLGKRTHRCGPSLGTGRPSRPTKCHEPRSL